MIIIYFVFAFAFDFLRLFVLLLLAVSTKIFVAYFAAVDGQYIYTYT